MAKRNQGTLSDLLEITRSFPWYIGIALAVASYMLLHSYAIQEVPKPSGVNGTAEFATSSIVKIFATYFQYLIPGTFIVAAVYSFTGRFERKALFNKASGSKTFGTYDWKEFEMLVGEVFRRQGYSVVETSSGPDGGVDLIIKKDSDTFVVQCKNWLSSDVGVRVVREIFGVAQARGAAGAIVATSGDFTEDARQFAKESNTRLINGDRLRSMISQVEKSNAYRQKVARKPEIQSSARKSLQRTCPVCASSMRKRVARKGKYKGKEFWGCARFPACRGTRNN